ncbi:MAG: molybdate ABC transporter substrate-binding protein [Gammaproteobacteria bacterium]|nr:molybdate ABC transporter substrate-binding protein [Gammaproteobacteria bacterium]NIR98035.1 molybdate ABC transporter substrate-binding protein [Gammaproteobacteria bacterium]NIT63742.1 molybdate ABC transporter substrate-binding protein [Gammaproteobacteria bacterium]NIV19917.1 molybdate ABC transporter substrate-binding protein [Gammaproteobacteria bacterium]NIX11406.1 molybdate ABC transporter substrate-binding protein [Gammaproteobacteria bacterium]
MVLACASAWSAPAAGEEVHVAVASNFRHTLRVLARDYESQGGSAVKVSSASTGKLYAQIRKGAPYDLFLAADTRRPAHLEADGLTVPGERFTYALGRLALWSPDPNLLDDGAGALKGTRIERLAIANPKTAPYGEAARQALVRLELWPRYRRRVVRGENVSQAFQFAAARTVDAAFVALSQLCTSRYRDRGSLWEVPPGLYDPIEQQAALLNRAAANRDAREFLAFLRSPGAREILRAHGYRLP